jgi:hypothetical protein
MDVKSIWLDQLDPTPEQLKSIKESNHVISSIHKFNTNSFDDIKGAIEFRGAMDRSRDLGIRAIFGNSFHNYILSLSYDRIVSNSPESMDISIYVPKVIWNGSIHRGVKKDWIKIGVL